MEHINSRSDIENSTTNRSIEIIYIKYQGGPTNRVGAPDIVLVVILHDPTTDRGVRQGYFGFILVYQYDINTGCNQPSESQRSNENS